MLQKSSTLIGQLATVHNCDWLTKDQRIYKLSSISPWISPHLLDSTPNKVNWMTQSNILNIFWILWRRQSAKLLQKMWKWIIFSWYAWMYNCCYFLYDFSLACFWVLKNTWIRFVEPIAMKLQNWKLFLFIQEIIRNKVWSKTNLYLYHRRSDSKSIHHFQTTL